MKLLTVRLHCPDTLGDIALSFTDGEDVPRPLTLVWGSPGSGKTSLVSAIGNTRPGHNVALGMRSSDPRCYAECRWQLGMDEPDRTQPLVLHSPNAPVNFVQSGPTERRDAAFVEGLTREGGFACLTFSALRWFSKSPVLLRAPDRGAGRYELRSREPLDDASKHDLAPDVKQALAYAAIVRALPQATEERYQQLGDAMSAVVDALVQLGGFRYTGLDPRTLEARFVAAQGEGVAFDALPTHLKHCVAFGALSVRAVWSAYPGVDPRRAEAVVAIDEVDLHQDSDTAAALLDVLASELPQIQWIFTTRSSALLAARDEGETLALHKVEAAGRTSVHTGADARVH